MSCLLILLGLGAPRIVIIAILLSTDWMNKAYETTIWPLLGWFLLPCTTLVYMMARLNCPEEISSGYIVLMVIAIMADLSCNGSAANQTKDN